MYGNSVFNITSALPPTSFFGRAIPGYFGDRLGPLNVMVAMAALSSILTLGLWIPAKSNAPNIVFSALYGFSAGAFISLLPAVVAVISKYEEIGTRIGTCYMVGSIAVLVSNPIGGALVPNPTVDPFWKLQVLTGVMFAGGTVGCLITRIYLTGFKLMKRV